MTPRAWLCVVTLLVVALGALAAAAGLFWLPPGEMALSQGLYGQGLYRRDTPFTAGGAQGADLLGLFIVVPVTLWALALPVSGVARLILIGSHAWWLYLGVSLAFGAVAFNEVFPLYVAMIPVSTAGLALALNGVADMATPRFLPVFLIGCGVVTGLVWTLLLWQEMAADAFPPATYYTVRTTYAIDLGVIAPGCIAAGVALWRGTRWGLPLALPLLSIATLLLPMMVLQTIMQLRAGVAFGPEAAAPLIGFLLISGGAAWFLRALIRRADAGVSDRPTEERGS